jgi:hypothetical protein
MRFCGLMDEGLVGRVFSLFLALYFLILSSPILREKISKSNQISSLKILSIQSRTPGQFLAPINLQINHDTEETIIILITR